SGAGGFLLVGNGGGTAYAVDLKTDKVRGSYSGHGEGGIHLLGLSRDGRFLVSSRSGGINVYDIQHKREVYERRSSAHQNPFALSRDGKTLYDLEGTDVLVIDPATGRQLRKFTNVRGTSFLVLSPDGKTLATASSGHGVVFWDVATAKQLRKTGEPPWG